MADKQTVIGSDTQITGEVRSEGGLEVRGRIEGKISVAETLTISNGAIIQADLDARVIEISGAVVGSVTASEVVRLHDKARVVGNIQAPRVGIASGAQYRGHVEMGEVDVAQRVGKAAGASVKVSASKVATRAAEPAAVNRVAPRVASVPARKADAPAPAWARKKAKHR
jgi:cytoskeletal protein CcmA (bactofilin family)